MHRNQGLFYLDKVEHKVHEFTLFVFQINPDSEGDGCLNVIMQSHYQTKMKEYSNLIKKTFGPIRWIFAVYVR